MFRSTNAEGRAEAMRTPSESACDIGRFILQETKYPVTSTRHLRPEQYLHPKGSIEAKKTLLLGLSPMLTDAERERSREATACESFTRCRSNKARSRNCSFEYTDIDTHIKTAYSEYEKRYFFYYNALFVTLPVRCVSGYSDSSFVVSPYSLLAYYLRAYKSGTNASF